MTDDCRPLTKPRGRIGEYEARRLLLRIKVPYRFVDMTQLRVSLRHFEGFTDVTFNGEIAAISYSTSLNFSYN